MALKPEDKYVVLSVAQAIYCARIAAGEKLPDNVSVAAEAKNLFAAVDRHLAPQERRKKPEEISLNERHRRPSNGD